MKRLWVSFTSPCPSCCAPLRPCDVVQLIDAVPVVVCDQCAGSWIISVRLTPATTSMSVPEAVVQRAPVVSSMLRLLDERPWLLDRDARAAVPCGYSPEGVWLGTGWPKDEVNAA